MGNQGPVLRGGKTLRKGKEKSRIFKIVKIITD